MRFNNLKLRLIIFFEIPKNIEMTPAKEMKAKIIELDACPKHPVDRDTITIARDFEPRQVVQLAVENGALHIVQKNSRSLNHELQVADAMMFKSHEFLANPLAFLLDQNSKSHFRVDCEATTNKKEPLEKLEQFIQAQPGSKAIVSEVISSTEEIFTNASKNTGTFYKRLENVNPSQAPKQGSISLVAGTTPDTLVVGCIDSFGLLNVQALMTKVLACYDKGVAKSINMGAGGAGIGTFLVFSFAMNMYIAVEKNKKTAVFCSYPLGMRAKEFELLPKNLHLMSI